MNWILDTRGASVIEVAEAELRRMLYEEGVEVTAHYMELMGASPFFLTSPPVDSPLNPAS